MSVTVHHTLNDLAERIDEVVAGSGVDGDSDVRRLAPEDRVTLQEVSTQLVSAAGIVKQLAARDADLMGELVTVRKENAEYLVALEGLMSDCDDLAGSLRSLQQERDELRDTCQAQDADLEQMTAGAAGAAAVIEDMKSALTAATSRAGIEADERVQSLRNEVRSVRDQLEQAETRRQTLVMVIDRQSEVLAATQRAQFQAEEASARQEILTAFTSTLGSLSVTAALGGARIESAAASEAVRLMRETGKRDDSGTHYDDMLRLRSAASSLEAEVASLRRSNSEWPLVVAADRHRAALDIAAAEETMSRAVLERNAMAEYAAVALVALRFMPREAPRETPAPTGPAARATDSDAVPVSPSPAPRPTLEMTTRGIMVGLNTAVAAACQTEAHTCADVPRDAARPSDATQKLTPSPPPQDAAESLEDQIIEYRESVERLEVQNQRLSDDLARAKDDSALRAQDAAQLRRHVSQLEQVVCAVEQEKATLHRDFIERERAALANAERLRAERDDAQRTKTALETAASELRTQLERTSMADRVSLLEAQNENVQLRTTVEEALARASVAQGEAHAADAKLAQQSQELGEARDKLMAAEGAWDVMMMQLRSTEASHLFVEEARARQALLHEWALYAAQRSHHSRRTSS